MPRVMGQTCCIIENDVNEWCIYQEDPMLEVGWDVQQTFSSETISSASVQYWNMRLMPYAQASIYIQNTVDLGMLYFNELTVDLDQFLANVFLELRIYGNG
eukprot:CAMPEP_0202963538 /NCGR_PEP_ID=MMETSP1396-20130829/7548_1 /ASSEMBLY_ACC=CAM_ASM_000872 /TAXON_ID= /ORGANISM="Pseudokeronopsis sp., Strain Brazil" /LENGTH=100 /DNA_ID=CAMNT_0049684845 /DNA_START=100 /DNA_END=402 /DNA_ORIENTATION=-